jgi:hypothetical protein
MNEQEGNPYLKAAIMEVVENQLRDKSPPETLQTFERLIQEGHSEEDAKRLIGVVVSSEMFAILKNQEPFNEEKFIQALNKLPAMPWD